MLTEKEIEARISRMKAYSQLLNQEIEELEKYCRQAKAASLTKEDVSTSSFKKAHLEKLAAEAVAKRHARLERKSNNNQNS